MSKTLEVDRSEAHVGKTKGISNHDHDLVHELSKRLDGVWRYDQYIANADGEDAPQVQKLWQEIKEQDLIVVERLKQLIRDHVRKDCF
jgi:methionyl-tRNA synthetase